jgi:hypothetical protein
MIAKLGTSDLKLLSRTFLPLRLYLEEDSPIARIKKIIEDFYDEWYAAWALEIGGPCKFI